MPWIRRTLKGNSVFARCDESGELVVEGGRVEIRYNRKSSKAYRAGARNLQPADDATVFDDDHCGEAEPAPERGGEKKTSKKQKKTTRRAPPHEEGAVIVYADGACSRNPGPAGLGVVVIDGDERAELSEYLGTGTNNIAELTGILRAAERLKGSDKPVRIHTDSQYSIGVLTKGGKAKKNKELIRDVKAALSALDDVEVYYVPGHAGVELNERADELARAAVDSRATSGWV